MPTPPPALAFDALDLAPGEFEERLALARRAGRPRFPWPGVDPAEWRRARLALAELVGRVLAGDAGRPPALESEVDAVTVGVAGFTTGVGPLLGLWHAEGRVELPDDVAALCELHLRHGRARARTGAEVLGATAAALGSAGVPLVVLKGGDTGRRFFPEAGVRPAGDLDVLVPPHRFEEAAVVLAEAGFRRGTGKLDPPTLELEPPGTSARVRSLELFHADNPFGLDLHGTLDRDFFRVATVRFGRPGAHDTEPHPDLPGVSVLAEPLLTGFLAVHASHGLHGLTLLRLVELVLVTRARRSGGGPDGDEVAARLREAGGLGFAWPALELAERLVPGTVEPALLRVARGAAPPRARRLVDGLRPGEAPSPDRPRPAERFMWCRSPLDHVRRALDVLWPRSEGDSWGRRARVWRDRWAVLTGRPDDPT